MQRIIHLVVCWFLCGLAVATNFAEETKEKIKVLLVTGGHGFEVLEEVQMLEVKQGPYAGEMDKTRFKYDPNLPVEIVQ